MPGAGEATLDDEGVLTGVPVLLFNRSAGGTHPVRGPYELPEKPV